MLHVHEVHKIVNDLAENGNYQLAFEICAQYRQQFDDGYLAFRYLTLPAKMGDFDRTIELLVDALETNSWISVWAMEQFDLFRDFQNVSAFQEFMANLQIAEQAYRASKLAKPVTRPPQHGVPPYPLLVCLHGNGLNAIHSADNWAAAETFGWLTTHPQAKNIIGFHRHWWSDMSESKRLVHNHVSQIQQQHEIDSGRIIIGGFSSGGQVALELALEGQLGAKGFILVGAGGQYFEKPNAYWKPRIQNAPKNLRGVMFYSAYDIERSGTDVERLLTLFEKYGINVKFVDIDIAGHGFPGNYPEDLAQALQFILQ